MHDYQFHKKDSAPCSELILAGPGGRAVTGIVGSNPARGMDICLYVSVLCCLV
jgi:hypothetical protein